MCLISHFFSYMHCYTQSQMLDSTLTSRDAQKSEMVCHILCEPEAGRPGNERNMLNTFYTVITSKWSLRFLPRTPNYIKPALQYTAMLFVSNRSNPPTRLNHMVYWLFSFVTCFSCSGLLFKTKGFYLKMHVVF